MKPHTLPVKRRPMQKGILKRLSAVTGNHRKQRVAATANAADLEAEDNSSKISRALTIIFLIHIVAIGLIFVHQTFLDGRIPEQTAATEVKKEVKPLVSLAPQPRRADVPRLGAGEKPYVVRAGDNYSRIALSEGVDENELRRANEHAEITPGLILRIPNAPAQPVAQNLESPSTTELAVNSAESGLVEAIDVSNAPRAVVVRPNVSHGAAVGNAPAASGRTYVVESGDSIWRIANRFKVDQNALMKANNISDARRMKIGMTLVIPE